MFEVTRVGWVVIAELSVHFLGLRICLCICDKALPASYPGRLMSVRILDIVVCGA
jgi:hypothetical protein